MTKNFGAGVNGPFAFAANIGLQQSELASEQTYLDRQKLTSLGRRSRTSYRRRFAAMSWRILADGPTFLS
jgi:hypothetical protein